MFPAITCESPGGLLQATDQGGQGGVAGPPVTGCAARPPVSNLHPFTPSICVFESPAGLPLHLLPAPLPAQGQPDTAEGITIEGTGLVEGVGYKLTLLRKNSFIYTKTPHRLISNIRQSLKKKIMNKKERETKIPFNYMKYFLQYKKYLKVLEVPKGPRGT